jgi:hypothetical protein
LLEADPPFPVGAGGFEVWLGTATTTDVLLGTLAPTTGPGAWDFRSFTFTAPVNAASLPVLIFRPFVAPSDLEAWPGIDSVSLEQVPEPETLAFLVLGALAADRIRRRSMSNR